MQTTVGKKIQVLRGRMTEVHLDQVQGITDRNGLLGAACPDLSANWLAHHISSQRPSELVLSEMACSPVLVALGRSEEDLHVIRGIRLFLYARLMGIDRIPVRLIGMTRLLVIFHALDELLYQVRYPSRSQKRDAIFFFRWLTQHSVSLPNRDPIDGYSMVKRLLGMGRNDKNVFEQICRVIGVNPRTARKWGSKSQSPKETSRRDDAFIRSPLKVDMNSLVTTDPRDHQFVNRSPNHPTNDVNSEYQQIDWIWEGE